MFPKSRVRRRVWVFAALACAIAGGLLVSDYFFGTNLIGATGRLMWQWIIRFGEFLVELVILAWRAIVVTLEHLVALFPSIASARVTKFLWPIMMGTAAGLYFSHRDPDAPPGIWQRFKSALTRLRESVRVWWSKQLLITKSLVVVALIAIQMHLQWQLILFPIGFMIPYMLMMLRSTQRWVVGPVVEYWYLKVMGTWHERLKRWLMGWRIVRTIVGSIRLFRLYFDTGWRLWYYDRRFAYPEMRPFWRTTIGRVRFALATIPAGEWAKRRIYREPLLGGGKSRSALPYTVHTHAFNEAAR